MTFLGNDDKLYFSKYIAQSSKHPLIIKKITYKSIQILATWRGGLTHGLY
jgi:hypothetical protein